MKKVIKISTPHYEISYTLDAIKVNIYYTDNSKFIKTKIKLKILICDSLYFQFCIVTFHRMTIS